MSSHDTTPKVRTCLWFDAKGEEAAEFYASLLPNSAVGQVVRPDPEGPAQVVELSLAGTPYMFLNGGPMFPQTPAASIVVRTADQAETDRLWDALVADGGSESRCGWLTDRFGVSWQITPDALVRMLSAPDREAAGRAVGAMMTMNKIDIRAMEAAFAGDGGA
ncbi:MAG: VOC family protein [Myxococcota bacterium]